MAQARWLIIGDGGCALTTAAVLAKTDAQVTWVTAQGSRVLPPVTTLSNEAAQFLSQICEDYGVEAGTFEPGQFVREFKNKSFREPEFEAGAWGPEGVFLCAEEGTLSKDLFHIESELREKVLAEFEAHPQRLKRITGNPIQEIKSENSRAISVVLGSGEELTFDHAVYADRWSALPAIQGLPKPISFLKGRDSFGTIQATFQHNIALGEDLVETFYGAQTKEAGEEIYRNVLGYFTSTENKSVWTTFLTHEEGEDNHMIAKRLRKMKQALNKMFEARLSALGIQKTFSDTIADETVHFNEAGVFGSGEKVMAPIEHAKLLGMWFATDGYGMSSSMLQVKTLVGSFYETRTNSEAVDMNFASAEITQSL